MKPDELDISCLNAIGKKLFEARQDLNKGPLDHAELVKVFERLLSASDDVYAILSSLFEYPGR